MASRDALTELSVAFDCPARWSAMSGDDRSRHCTHCNRNVYNISDMGREEAIDFLESQGAKVCVRYYQRRDGTILTKPCGRMKRAKYRMRIAVASICAALGFVALPLAMPVYAGQRRLSPEQQIRSSLRQMTNLRQQLAEETDHDARAFLLERIERVREDLRRAYREVTPAQLEKWALEKPLDG